jgi:hypothetical protein
VHSFALALGDNKSPDEEDEVEWGPFSFRLFFNEIPVKDKIAYGLIPFVMVGALIVMIKAAMF